MTSALPRYDPTTLTLAFADGADLTVPAAWPKASIGDGIGSGDGQHRFDLAHLDRRGTNPPPRRGDAAQAVVAERSQWMTGADLGDFR